MSKKSRRHKQHIERKDRSNPQQLATRQITMARERMLQGNFEGAINICEPLLNLLPEHSSLRIEALALCGMSHGMLQHYQKSHDIFTEAVAVDPHNADLWYNRGLACIHTGRIGQALLDYERAYNLLGTTTGEIAQKFAKELNSTREETQEIMEMLGEHFTLDQLIEQEEDFQRGIQMTMNSNWTEAEQAFRQVLGRSERIAQYWGNLGVCLIMQLRYDEAEEALKRALEIDPLSALARENLEKLPKIRQTGGAAGTTIRNLPQDEKTKQTLTFYERRDGDTPTYQTIEKDGNTLIKSQTPIGKQPPRHRFLLNPYSDTRFTLCPRCGYKSRTRKFYLVVLVQPYQSLGMDKLCRYCYHCDMIIAHQDQVEEQLAAHFAQVNPDIIGNDYVVAGTVDLAVWKRVAQDHLLLPQLVEELHDFKEVVVFKPEEEWRRNGYPVGAGEVGMRGGDACVARVLMA